MSTNVNYKASDRSYKITTRRAVNIALSDNKKQALNQGGRYLSGKDYSQKDEDNKAIFSDINQGIDAKKNFPNDAVQAIDHITNSNIINKFIKFIKMKSKFDDTDQKNFKIIIKKPNIFNNSYRITFADEGDDSILYNLKNAVQGQCSRTYDITPAEAKFLERYIDKTSGALIDEIDTLEVAMQYMLSTKISEIGTLTKEQIETVKIKPSDDAADSKKRNCENHIKNLVYAISKDIKNNEVIVNSEGIFEDKFVSLVQIEFNIDELKKIKIEYKESYDDSKKIYERYGYRVAEVNNNLITLDEKQKEKIDKSIIYYEVIQNNSKSMNNKLHLYLDLNNFESITAEYATKEWQDYKEFVGEKLRQGKIIQPSNISADMITSTKYLNTLHGKIIALMFFVERYPNGEAFSKLRDSNITQENLILKLIERSNSPEKNLLNNFEHIATEYANTKAEEFKNFIKEEISHKELSLYDKNYLKSVYGKAAAISFFIIQNQNDEVINNLKRFGISSEILIYRFLKNISIESYDNRKVSFINNYKYIIKNTANKYETVFGKFKESFIKEFSNESIINESDNIILHSIFYANQPNNKNFTKLERIFNNLITDDSMIYNISSMHFLNTEHKDAILGVYYAKKNLNPYLTMHIKASDSTAELLEIVGNSQPKLNLIKHKDENGEPVIQKVTLSFASHLYGDLIFNCDTEEDKVKLPPHLEKWRNKEKSKYYKKYKKLTIRDEKFVTCTTAKPYNEIDLQISALKNYESLSKGYLIDGFKVDYKLLEEKDSNGKSYKENIIEAFNCIYDEINYKKKSIHAIRNNNLDIDLKKSLEIDLYENNEKYEIEKYYVFKMIRNFLGIHNKGTLDTFSDYENLLKTAKNYATSAEDKFNIFLDKKEVSEDLYLTFYVLRHKEINDIEIDQKYSNENFMLEWNDATVKKLKNFPNLVHAIKYYGS